MKAKDLKSSILQMAVEGKLVPQDPDDEPASVLLERIREEKLRLIAEGKAKFPKGGESVIYIGSDGSPYEKRVDAKGRVLSDECIADEVPFEELPEGWAWTRLGNLLSLVSDGTHKTPQYTESGVLFLSVQNVSGGSFDLTKVRHVSQETHEELCKRVKPDRGDILLCRIGTLGKPIIVDVDYEFSIFVSLGLLRPVSIAIAKWICSCIDSPIGFAWIEAVKVGGGTHTFKINLGDIPDFVLPLPPLPEQRRIVERVGELMPLVEEYGKLEDAREELDAALPDRLRKSVLQMAVQGKLAPQDPADEPASVLLKRIREQRRKMIAEKKMKSPKGGESVIYTGSDGRRYEKRVDAKGRESEPVCIEDEIPFEIPEGWEWARLGSLCDFGKCQNVEYEDVAEGAWSLDLEDIEKDSGIILRKKRKTKGEGGSTKHAFSSGAVLYSKLRPYLNKVVIADEDGVCSSEILPLNFLGLNNEYAQLTLMEPGFVEYAKECSYGVKMPRLGTDDGKRWLVAVPPMGEQHRIVAAFKAYTTNAL